MYHQYNLTAQYEFAPDWLAEVAYVGSAGRNLLTLTNIGTGNDEGGPGSREVTGIGASNSYALHRQIELQLAAKPNSRSVSPKAYQSWRPTPGRTRLTIRLAASVPMVRARETAVLTIPPGRSSSEPAPIRTYGIGLLSRMFTICRSAGIDAMEATCLRRLISS